MRLGALALLLSLPSGALAHPGHDHHEEEKAPEPTPLPSVHRDRTATDDFFGFRLTPKVQVGLDSEERPTVRLTVPIKK